MIEHIITFALKQRLFIIMSTVLLILTGIWAVLNLPVDSFPDVSNVQVQVITEPETMATKEVEQQITFPIENCLNGLPGLQKVRSNSSFGLSVVTAIFDDDVDVYFARQVVQQRLNQLELPGGSSRPLLGPVVSSFSQVFMYYLESKNFDLTELRTIQDWYVARRLRSVAGVGNIVSYGGYVKQYQVFVDPLKLKHYDLTLKDVMFALESNNTNAGGNFIEQGEQEVIIRGLGRIESLDDIRAIVLKSVDGVPVTIANVATVETGPAFRRGSASIDGKGEAVTGIVLSRKGANTRSVVEQIKKSIDQIAKDLPSGVRIHPFYDQSELVEKTIETVKEILILSSGLVIVILFALLFHIPSALIVTVILPLSLLFSFIMMKFSGLSANLMTLGAVEFGVIVDSAVVMVENVFRNLAHASSEHRAEGNKELSAVERLQIVQNSAWEVGRPIVFAIFIIIAVYVPLFALEGVEGKMFRPLALTFIYAILGALVISLTLIPVFCFWFMRGKMSEKHSPVFAFAQNLHTPALNLAIKFPKIVLLVSALLLLVAFAIVPFLGSEFIPTIDEGSILLRTKLAASVSHTESRRIATEIEKSIKSFPEVSIVVSRIGRSGMGSDLDGVDNADVYVGLYPKKEWKSKLSKEDLVNKMAACLKDVPGLVYSFSQPIADMIDDLIAGIKADLGIKIFGADLHELDNVALKIQNIVSEVRGSADVQREHILGLPQMNIRLKRREIARYGINVSDVQEIISTAVAGKVVGEVLEDTKRFDLLLRYPSKYRDSEEDIESILVSSPTGARIPLKALADIEIRDGDVMVNREDGERRTAVLANVRGRDLGSFVEEIRNRVNKEISLPRGYRIVYGGQFENQEHAMARLSIVVPIVLLLIFVLLFASLGSLKNASLIILNVPFALIGGIIALFLTKQTLSVPAIIGFIALFGVAVQNGLILVSYIMHLQKEGFTIDQAVVNGTAVRLRPVLITATVAIMGLIPKVMSEGVGAEVQRPLATVVLGGLISATLLTLIVLPVLYRMFNKNLNKEIV